MVLEGDNELVPAWQVASDLHGHKFGQPGDVLNLLLLEFQECVEACEVETIFESLRETRCRFLEHDLI